MVKLRDYAIGCKSLLKAKKGYQKLTKYAKQLLQAEKQMFNADTTSQKLFVQILKITLANLNIF